jgi:hypothetical protein
MQTKVFMQAADQQASMREEALRTAWHVLQTVIAEISVAAFQAQFILQTEG